MDTAAEIRRLRRQEEWSLRDLMLKFGVKETLAALGMYVLHGWREVELERLLGLHVDYPKTQGMPREKMPKNSAGLMRGVMEIDKKTGWRVG